MDQRLTAYMLSEEWQRRRAHLLEEMEAELKAEATGICWIAHTRQKECLWQFSPGEPRDGQTRLSSTSLPIDDDFELIIDLRGGVREGRSGWDTHDRWINDEVVSEYRDLGSTSDWSNGRELGHLEHRVRRVAGKSHFYLFNSWRWCGCALWNLQRTKVY